MSTIQTVRVLFLAGVLLLLPEAGFGSENLEFVWEGRLTKGNGAPLDGPVALTISFFHGPTDAEPVLSVTDGLDNVPLVEGIFQVKLNLTPSQYHSVFTRVSQTVYVQVTNRSDPNSLPFPRQEISLVPYAAKIPVDDSTVTFDSFGRLTVQSVPISLVNNLSDVLATKTTKEDVSGMITERFSAGHTHSASDIVDFDRYLDTKASIDQAVSGDVTGTLTGTVVSGLRGWSLGSPQVSDAGKFIQFNGGGFSYVAGNKGTVTNVSGISPISVTNGTTTPVIAMKPATGTQSGYLRAEDFGVFAAKQNAITPESIVNAGSISTARQNGVQILPYGSAEGETGRLLFQSMSGNTLGLRAPDSVSADTIWTLPVQDGTPGQALVTDGTGKLSWSTALPLDKPSGVFTKVTTNSQGLVTAGSTLEPEDIPNIDASKVSSGHILVPSDPTLPLQAASKQYVDAVKNSISTDAKGALYGTAPVDYNPSSGEISLQGLSNLGSGNQVIGVNSAANGLEYKNLLGTDKQVAIANSGDGVTFSLPQDIATDSAPTFQGLTVSGLSTGIVKAGSNGDLSASAVDLGTGDVTGVLPITNGGTGQTAVPGLGQFLAGNGLGGYSPTQFASGPFAGVTTVSAAGSITLDTVQDLRPSATPSFTGMTVGSSGILSPRLTVGTEGGASGRLTFQSISGNSLGLRAPDSTTFDTLWTLPAQDGTSGQALVTDGAGNLAWTSTPLPLNKPSGVFTKVTTNSQGLVTAGATLEPEDIPNLNASKITTGHILVPGNPIAQLEAAPKQYVDGVKNAIPADAKGALFGRAPVDYNFTTGEIGLQGLSNLGTGNQVIGVNSAGNGLEYKNLLGTDKQVAIANSGDGVTFSLPQDIATDSAPTFQGLTVSGLSTGIVKAGNNGDLSASAVDLGTGDVTGVLPITNGGTGQTAVPGLGQFLAGNGSGGYSPTQFTSGPFGGVTSVSAAGTITLDTVQDLRTIASPSFNGITLASGGVLTPSVTAALIQGTPASASDTSGATLSLSGGAGQGTGSSGAITFKTGVAGSASGATITPLTTRMMITPEGYIGIATTTPGARVDIATGEGSVSGLIVRATDGSQTADLTQWLNASGTTLAKVDKDGYLTLPGVPTSDFQAATKKYVDDSINEINSSISNLSTSVVPEGTNRYFTEERARNSLSAVAPLVYSSSSGEMTIKGLGTFGTSNQLMGVAAAGGTIEYKSLAGTADQITVTHSAGGISLTTPQNIAATSSPTFAHLSLTGPSAGVMKLGLGGGISTSKVDLGTTGITEEVTGVLPVAKGGTGLSAAPIPGQILIGDDNSGYSLGQITAGTGIVVVSGPGSISIATSQGLTAGDSPSFLGLSVGSGGLDSPSKVTTPLIILGAGETLPLPPLVL